MRNWQTNLKSIADDGVNCNPLHHFHWLHETFSKMAEFNDHIAQRCHLNDLIQQSPHLHNRQANVDGNCCVTLLFGADTRQNINNNKRNATKLVKNSVRNVSEKWHHFGSSWQTSAKCPKRVRNVSETCRQNDIIFGPLLRKFHEWSE